MPIFMPTVRILFPLPEARAWMALVRHGIPARAFKRDIVVDGVQCIGCFPIQLEAVTPLTARAVLELSVDMRTPTREPNSPGVASVPSNLATA